MTFSRFLVCCSLILSTLAPHPLRAEPIDPAAARELLKQGYSLKKEGKYSDALERLLESLRLDSQIKTLMNIADCEEMLLQFTTAQKHWILARDQASLQGDQILFNETQKRLDALEARMPRLTINVAPPQVAGTEVRRNGVLLGAVALGVPLPTDPTHHVVVVSAPGRAEGRYELDLVEKDNKVIDVTVGASIAPNDVSASPVASAAPVAATGSQSSSPDRASESGKTATGLGTQRIVGLVAMGVGAATTIAGAIFGGLALSKYDSAKPHCPNNLCDDEGAQISQDAKSQGNVAKVLFVVGGAAIIGGGITFLLAPKNSSSRAMRSTQFRMGLGNVTVVGQF